MQAGPPRARRRAKLGALIAFPPGMIPDRPRPRVLRAGSLAAGALAAVLACGNAPAQVATASGADAAPASARAPEFGSLRVEVRNDYQDLQGGGHADMLVPRFDYAVNRDLSLRVETPFVSADPHTPGNDGESGFGDLLFRGSYRVAHGPGYALVAGAELILDTASGDTLGMGKNVVAPLVFASIDVPQCNSVLFPFAQYYFTVGGNDARPDVDYLSLKAPFLTRWPSLVYTIVEPQIVVDHERSDKVGVTLEGEVGKFLDRDLALWARPGLGLFGDDLPQVYNWKFEVGVRYFFK